MENNVQDDSQALTVRGTISTYAQRDLSIWRL